MLWILYSDQKYTYKPVIYYAKSNQRISNKKSFTVYAIIATVKLFLVLILFKLDHDSHYSTVSFSWFTVEGVADGLATESVVLKR